MRLGYRSGPSTCARLTGPTRVRGTVVDAASRVSGPDVELGDRDAALECRAAVDGLENHGRASLRAVLVEVEDEPDALKGTGREDRRGAHACHPRVTAASRAERGRP